MRRLPSANTKSADLAHFVVALRKIPLTICKKYGSSHFARTPRTALKSADLARFEPRYPDISAVLPLVSSLKRIQFCGFSSWATCAVSLKDLPRFKGERYALRK